MEWVLMILLVLALSAAAWEAEKVKKLRRESATRAHAVERDTGELPGVLANGPQLLVTNRLASLGQVLGEVAHDIQAPLGLARGNLDMVAEMLGDYRQLVQQYDVAVQYCLQPVDLIFSADKSNLDKLVKHVEDARRKLFEARANLEKNSLIKNAKALLADSGDSLDELAGTVAKVDMFIQPGDATPALVDVGESLGRALALAQHWLRGRVEVVNRVGDLPKLRCASAQLDRIFLNLIVNAGQAIDGKGNLTIDGRAVGDDVEIRFVDSGRGIAEDNLPKIFDPFFTTRPTTSSGLGLTVAHYLVKELGGTIDARTAPGKGSALTISLPLSAATTTAVADIDD
jgi:signal transduction histidine kinase